MLPPDKAIWRPFTQHQTAACSLKVKSGRGTLLTLEDGRELIDAISSWWVNLHGHGHPKIAEAIYQQALKLEHVIFAGFSHDPAEELVKKLQPFLPSHLTRFFYSDNGSTAVEVALKMAYQTFWNRGEKRSTFVAFEGGYHGDTLGAVSVGARSLFNAPFEHLLFDVERVPYPATFFGDPSVEEKDEKALKAFKKIFLDKGSEIAAVIIEPLIQGVAGMRQARPQFLEQMEKIARQSGALLIFDEVMTGFGRTGTFLATDQSGCKPDFICLSKGITGGFLPLALTITTEDVFESFLSNEIGKAFHHGHSYTANPLGCAAAIASLELLKEKPYEKMEERINKEAEALVRHPLVKRARGLGGIFAFDLATEEKGYGSQVGNTYRELVEKEGVLIRPLGETVYVMPPYSISNKELQKVFHTLQGALASL